MSSITLIFGAMTGLIALFIFLVWVRSRASVRTSQAANRGRTISYMLLTTHVLVPSIFADYFRDPSALVTQGLSAQNITEAAVAMTAFGWAVWLFVGRSVSAVALVSGVNFWIGLAIALFGLSTTWSLWPSMTLFRTIELGAFWVLCLHLFSGRPLLVRLTWCLLAAAGLMLIKPFVYLAQYTPKDIYHLFTSNEGGMLAGALLTILFYRVLILRETRSWILLLPSATVFLVFGSLASAAALSFALVILLVFGLGRRLEPFTQLMIVIYVAGLVAFCLYEWVYTNPDAATWLAAVSQKDPRNITNATGRFDIWETMWMLMRNSSVGYGFGAGERLFFELTSVGPSVHATNAHNGFLSAWLSAGWLGAWTIFFLFVGAIVDAVRRPYRERSYRLPLVIFVTINNLSFPGVGGGTFNPGWFVMMVLACAGPIPEAEGFRRSYSYWQRCAPAPLRSVPQRRPHRKSNAPLSLAHAQE